MTPELSERIERIVAMLRTRKRTARQIAKALKISDSAARNTLNLMERMGRVEVIGQVENPEGTPAKVWACPKPAKPPRPVRVKAPKPTTATQAKPKPKKTWAMPAPPPIHGAPTLTRWVGGNPFAGLFRQDAR